MEAMMSEERTRLSHVSELVFRKPWAILPEKYATIRELVSLRASGARLSDDEIQARVGVAPPQRKPRRSKNVAVIPVYGTIVPRASLMTDISGGTSIQDLREAFAEAITDPEIGAVVFDVDSPGGVTDLVPEFAADIRSQRGKKPMYAVANTMMASAAYWIGSQADAVYASPSSLTGSIGVFATHEDVSAADEATGIKTTLISAGKYKTEGNPYEPLTADARIHIQDLVDTAYAQFTSDVARGRRAKVDDVRDGYGEGRVLTAQAAVKAGLADGVQTLEQTILKAFHESNQSAGEKLAATAGFERISGDELAASLTDTEDARGGSSFVDEVDAVLCMAEGLVAKGRPLTAAKRAKLEQLTERLGVMVASHTDSDPQVAAMRNRIRLARNHATKR